MHLSDDENVLKRFRKSAVDILPARQKRELWQRIERSIGKRLFPFKRYRMGVAAACMIGFCLAGYWWYAHREPVFKMLVMETGLQKQKVVLPDSSIVWLNACSRLEYPDNFAGRRFVNLEGEAYFHVAHRASQPFKVHVSGLDITVLGTVFNVTAYTDDAEIVTTLVSGKIALQINDDRLQTVLTPNQQAVFNKDSKDLTFATVDPGLFSGWVKGYYRFEDTPFEQIAKYLERIYGIRIVFEDRSLRSQSYTGTFIEGQDIESILNLLRDIRDFHFTIQMDQITISQ